MYICITEAVNTIDSACTVFLTCMPPGMTAWYWITDGCALPWRRLSLALSIPSSPIALCVGCNLLLNGSWIIPPHPASLPAFSLPHVPKDCYSFLFLYLGDAPLWIQSSCTWVRQASIVQCRLEGLLLRLHFWSLGLNSLVHIAMFRGSREEVPLDVSLGQEGGWVSSRAGLPALSQPMAERYIFNPMLLLYAVSPCNKLCTISYRSVCIVPVSCELSLLYERCLPQVQEDSTHKETWELCHSLGSGEGHWKNVLESRQQLFFW